MPRYFFGFWLLLSLVLQLTVIPSANAQQGEDVSNNGLTIELRTAPNSNGSHTLHVVLHNNTPQTLRVLRWGTPFEQPVLADAFIITDPQNAQVVPYTGPHAKWAHQASHHDFIHLASGMSIEQPVHLTALYDIPSAKAYQVQFHGIIRYALSNTNPTDEPLPLTGLNTLRHKTVISAEVSQHLAPIRTVTQGRAIDSQSCSPQQHRITLLAEQAAYQLASSSANSLADLAPSLRDSSPRYRQWFGDYTPDHYQAVTTHFLLLSALLSNDLAHYDCSCLSAHYAYVYAQRPYEIFLCQGFWQAPQQGSNSQAGTLIHEFSHFKAIAGTHDHAYGHSNSAALARLSNDAAISNADSYEYFAENTPYRPMQALALDDTGDHTANTHTEVSEAQATGTSDVSPVETQATQVSSRAKQERVLGGDHAGWVWLILLIYQAARRWRERSELGL